MTENPAAPEGRPAETTKPPAAEEEGADSPAESGPDSGPSAPPSTPPPAGPAAPAVAAAPASPASAPAAGSGGQSSSAEPRSVSYSVDIVFCIDVTGSMGPILDAVKTNVLGFYDNVQANLTDKGKNVAQLRVRVTAFRDFVADTDAALEESPFFTLPAERAGFSEFDSGLIGQGGGDAPESGLEAVALAVNSAWTTTGDRRRRVLEVPGCTRYMGHPRPKGAELSGVWGVVGIFRRVPPDGVRVTIR